MASSAHRRGKTSAEIDPEDKSRDDEAFRIARDTPKEKLPELARKLGIDYQAALRRLADSDACADAPKPGGSEAE